MYPTTSCLFVKDVFNLPDLLSDLTCEVFGLSFSLQIRIAGDLACFLFDFAFHFVKPAFNLILNATFHLFSPFWKSGGCPDGAHIHGAPAGSGYIRQYHAVTRSLSPIGFGAVVARNFSTPGVVRHVRPVSLIETGGAFQQPLIDVQDQLSFWS